jgi:hypothetical protein
MAEAGVNRPEGRGYSAAFNAWLIEHDMTGVSAQMRANAIFVIDNWAEAEIAIANANEHQKQTWALNGLRTAIEMARSEKWRAAEQKKQPVPKLKPYDLAAGAYRAMLKAGLTLNQKTDEFVPADEAVFFSFARSLLVKRSSATPASTPRRNPTSRRLNLPSQTARAILVVGSSRRLRRTSAHIPSPRAIPTQGPTPRERKELNDDD